MNNRFPKSEKLKSTKTIEHLFEQGKSFKKFPIKMIFLPQENLTSSQVAFAVPKRSFKLAVTRNLIKRQLRETYRLQKNILQKNNGKKFAILFLYLGKHKPQYAELENAMLLLLKKLEDENSKI